MQLFSDSIGRKVVMAVTGLLMVLFVVGHLLGNLTIFAGENGINAYAARLHELGPVVWGTRVVMGVAVILHLVISIQITLENGAAKPIRYKETRQLKATFASRNMIWTGLIIGAFVTYHLLHFTFRTTPGVLLGTDAEGRFDVFGMVVDAFRGLNVAVVVYVVAMISLFLHLSHGIQSTFQSLGLSNSALLPKYGAGGKWLSALFLVGYGSIPVLIFLGLLSH